MLAKILKGLFGRAAPRGVAPQDPVERSAIIRQATALQYGRDFEGAARLMQQFVARQGAHLSGRERADALQRLALCRLRQFRLEEASALFEEARRAFPAHPLVDRLAQYPALVSQSLPVRRAALEPMRSSGSGRRRGLAAVYYFLQLPHSVEGTGHGYFSLMGKSIESLKAVIPQARAILLTDRTTAVDGSAGFDEVLREDFDPNELVYGRLVGISKLLGSLRASEDIVLLDPDTLVLRDFRPVFELDFDLGFTVRSDFVEAAMDHEPINVGVILVRAEGASRAKSFFDLCIRHFPEVESRAAMRQFYPQGLRAWRGDQVLPAAVVGWREFCEHVVSGRTDRLRIGDCSVGFFESKLYNCSSPVSGGDAVQPFIVHYKGAHKGRMLVER